MPNFDAYKDGYLALWKKMQVTKTTEARQQVAAIDRARDRLMTVQVSTGVPWYVIGIIQVREAGLVNGNLDFKGVLHNGERIVGTKLKTRLVPKGLGPFATWEASALDCVRRQGWSHYDWHNADVLVERVAWTLEDMNGFGYRNHGIPSPYLWGGTSVQRRGKYIRDGVYSGAVMDPQIGGMALLRILMNEQVRSEDHPAETIKAHPAHEPVEGGKSTEPSASAPVVTQEPPKVVPLPHPAPAKPGAPTSPVRAPRAGLLAALWSLVRKVFKL
jgi:lysozyme family protein